MRLTEQHIPFARLADLAEGRLSVEDAGEARAHLAACARCEGQVAQLERVTGLMRADNSTDAPRDVLFNAIGLFRARRAADERPGLLRRVIASLTFDSSARATPAFGLRSGQTAPARQLLFNAGDFDVDLRLAADGEGWTVSGQVLGPCAAGQVELVAAGDEQAASQAALNELCEFTLPPVPEGSYTLRLRLDGLEVEVPELSLRA